MKHIKLFEDYTGFLKGVNPDSVEYHRAFDFSENEENNIRNFAKDRGLVINEIIGIGFGGVAFELNNDKVLKYTYDDIEVGACDFIEGKHCEYFADVYKIYEFNGAWIIILEKLKLLDKKTIDSLKEMPIDNKSGEYNFDELNNGFNVDIYVTLTEYQKRLYRDLIEIRKEGSKHGFELLDCKIDNLGFKNGHLAMFDIKHTGRKIYT
jgi:hypothetical protein